MDGWMRRTSLSPEQQRLMFCLSNEDDDEQSDDEERAYLPGRALSYSDTETRGDC